MRPFRRREPHHARLAREGGLSAGPDATSPGWGIPGVHAFQRAPEWDAVVVVEADVEGDRAAFVALEDETLVIEEGPDDVESLAAALERELTPPYRAEAVRREGSLWAVAGRGIEVVELPGISGEEIELVVQGPERSLLVDGERTVFGSIPALERPGHAVRARRLDGELWEVESAPL